MSERYRRIRSAPTSEPPATRHRTIDHPRTPRTGWVSSCPTAANPPITPAHPCTGWVSSCPTAANPPITPAASWCEDSSDVEVARHDRGPGKGARATDVLRAGASRRHPSPPGRGTAGPREAAAQRPGIDPRPGAGRAGRGGGRASTHGRGTAGPSEAAAGYRPAAGVRPGRWLGSRRGSGGRSGSARGRVRW